MKELMILFILLAILAFGAAGQSTLQPGRISSVPPAIKKCGALYSYDTVALSKRQYILLADFQDLAIMEIAGKHVNLKLTAAKTIGKTNISTYSGGGFTIILTSVTTGSSGKTDFETGTIEIQKGKDKKLVKMHGQSACDDK